MTSEILYLGDTELTGAGSYLAGVMSFYQMEFDYLASDKPFGPNFAAGDYSAIILSDYPAANFSPGQLETIAEQTHAGRGLLMIGGWESFNGLGNQYADTILSKVLPVVMQSGDDRVNCSSPALIVKNADHEIIDSLNFDKDAPGIGGFNKFQAKPDAEVILSLQRFKASRESGEFVFTPYEKPDPLLVLGQYGKGKVACLATDAAPHWVGGLVDWGDARVQAKAPGANEIEVGNWYAKLYSNLVKWTAGKL